MKLRIRKVIMCCALTSILVLQGLSWGQDRLANPVRPGTAYTSTKPLSDQHLNKSEPEIRSSVPIALNIPWSLTGQEILLELADPQGEYPPGIYAWNPFTSGDAPVRPRLLITGVHHPTWSPHHKRLIFEYAGDIGIADTEGNMARLQPALPPYLRATTDSPIQWEEKGISINVMRSNGWGSKVLLSPLSEDIPVQDLKSSYEKIFRLSYIPIIPLLKPYDGLLEDGKMQWTDLLTTNNATISPDGRFMASEVYPASPMDLQRSQSHIQIFELMNSNVPTARGRIQSTKGSPKETQAARKWFVNDLAMPPMKGQGKRLTSLGEGMVELRPVWSPSGNWIAFTVVNLKEGYMLPYVVRPDGKDLTPLATQHSSKGDKQAGTITAWGSPHIMALKWSTDGQYLWLSRGDEWEAGIAIAHQEKGQWLVNEVESITGGNFGILYKAFNGTWVAWIEDNGRPEKVIEVRNAEKPEVKTLDWKIRRGVEVLWMNW